jgi:hypothetical protein
MNIAFLNSWPNLTFSAEPEFIARMKLAGERLGWLVMEVTTPEDILLAIIADLNERDHLQLRAALAEPEADRAARPEVIRSQSSRSRPRRDLFEKR